MSRKKFIEKHGATCKNWNWSWSFINAEEKVIIFGAWDYSESDTMSIILSEQWKLNYKGHKQRGYPESLEHIRLVEEEGYQLKIFPIIPDEKQESEVGPSKIKEFIPELKTRTLVKIYNAYYASKHSDQSYKGNIPEEVEQPENYYEGSSSTVSVNVYERNPKAREACIKHYGYECAACSFNFEKIYGNMGKKFIHVHHKIPLSEIRKNYQIDPIKDLIPVCPNCHAMIHRTRPALSVEQLRKHLSDKTSL